MKLFFPAPPGRRLLALVLGLAFAPMAARSSALQTQPAAPQTQETAPQPSTRKAIETQKTEPAVASTADAPDTSKGPAEFKSLQYRSIGPWQGGRVTRVAGVPGNPSIYYFATASGGVWKSTNGGTRWTPIFDDQPIASIGSMAVSTSDPSVIYVGSGEANIRGNVAPGNGIYKSVDAGKTWTHVWKQEGQIGTMVVHPKNPDIAFAAVLGHALGPNAERGVYRSRDGGRTWQQVLKKNADTGASDVAMDPNNPSILFAGFWQARRFPWDMQSGGPGSGLYVSRDGGDTWKALTGDGLPEGIWGKVGLAVAPSDSRRVYALIEAENGGLFRSDDGGEHWTHINKGRALRQRAWYYTTMTVNPQNADDVWFPQVPMLRTIDGGKTLRYIRGIHHGDHHDVWIDPINPKRMITGNDGGVDITTDGGETWFAPALPLGQFYHVSADTRVPYRVAGAQQDLGTAQGPSNSLKGRITPSDWYDVGGGEAGHVVSDPADPNIVYAGEYLGYISRYDDRTKQVRNVSAWPENPSGHGGEDMRYRFQWTAPIASSPHDPKAIYHGAQVLFKTTDGGQTWTAISGDLTRNDKSKQRWAGGPITGDNTGVETYCTIFAVVESPKQKDLIWAGSDDGLVHVTRDGGKSWTNVTSKMRGFPEWGTVSLIEPSPFDAGTAYIVVDAHRLDDMRPYLFRTTDYGDTWTRLDGKLPQNIYLHAVREDPARKGMLYLGTERGVMFSRDAGATWESLQLNLPTVAVHDLVVKGDNLVLGTHGRSIWILDDLAPIRGFTGQIRGSSVHLFPIADTTRWRYTGGSRGPESGQNPPRGAALYYYLKAKTKGPIALEIADAQGRIVNTLSSEPKPSDGSSDSEAEPPKSELSKEPGVQRAVWNLQYAPARKIKGAKIDNGDTEGPQVAPGTYTAKLTVDGQTITAPIAVVMDPRVTSVSPADLATQVSLALEIRDDVTRLTGMVEQLRSITQQLQERRAALASQPDAADLIRASDALVTKLDDLEGRMHNPTAEVTYNILAMRGGTRLYSRMIPLLSWHNGGDGAPTAGTRAAYAEQKKELAGYETELRRLIDQDLMALNAMAGKRGVSYVVVPKG